MDNIKKAIDPDEIGTIDRYFIAYEWLPAVVLEQFDIRQKLQGVSEDVARQVFAVLSKHYAVKRDVRYDIVTSPTGKKGYMVTREVEGEIAKDVTDKEAMGEEVDWWLYAVETSMYEEGYHTFKPSQLDAAKVALADDPHRFLREFLGTEMDLDPEDVSDVLDAMRIQVLEVMELFEDKNKGQIVVPIPEKFTRVVPRLTTLADKPRKGDDAATFVPDTRVAVSAEIDAIFAQAA